MIYGCPGLLWITGVLNYYLIYGCPELLWCPELLLWITILPIYLIYGCPELLSVWKFVGVLNYFFVLDY